MQDKESIYLGFDFGLKRIGVAVGQTITKTATALTILSAKNGVPNWEEIGELVANWHPNAMVVGVPLMMDGSEQPLTKRSRKFAKLLAAKFKLPVYEAEERLTTKAARAEVFAHGGYQALQTAEVDAIAAKLILEGWMQNRP